VKDMRILFLSPYAPYPLHSGGALRIYHLLKALSRQHEVWCLTFAPEEGKAKLLEELGTFCHVLTVPLPPTRSLPRRAWTTLTSPLPDMAFRNLSPAFSATLQNLLQQETFAVIQAESIEMGRYLLELRRQRRKQPSLVLDEFNAEYLLQKGAAFTSIRERSAKGIAGAIYSLIQWQKLRAYERSLLQQVDHTLAVSEEDRQALLRLHPQAQISIIPNGVDSSSFTPRPSISPSPPYRLVFTGTLDFRPNVDAVLWFARAILPLVQKQIPQVKFVIVGRTPSAEVQALHNGQSIEVWANVPEIYPFLAAAAVFVLPMRMGGGIRLKLLEALALQLPTVSTPLGAMGVPELRNAEHLLLATTPEEFAEATLSLLKDEAMGKRLGVAGRNLVQAKYDWQEVGQKLADTL